MTSRWSAPAPPCSTARTSSSRRAKFAERREGQSRTGESGLAMILPFGADHQADRIPFSQRVAGGGKLLQDDSGRHVFLARFPAHVGNSHADETEEPGHGRQVATLH